MKLYTKTGDKGVTSLYDGTRKPKNSVEFDCLGDFDELNALLGLAKAFWKEIINESEIKYYNGPGAGGLWYKTEKSVDSGMYYEWYAFGEIITSIQCTIMDICSIIATPNNKYPFEEQMIIDIEKQIDRLDSLLPKLTNFVVPSGNKLVAQLHVCRTVTRRCERNILLLTENKNVNIYINRLSDFLFVLSRFVVFSLNINEDIYKRSLKE